MLVPCIGVGQSQWKPLGDLGYTWQIGNVSLIYHDTLTDRLFISGTNRYLGDSIEVNGFGIYNGQSVQPAWEYDTTCINFCKPSGPVIRYQNRLLYAKMEEGAGTKSELLEFDETTQAKTKIADISGGINHLLVWNNKLIVSGRFDTINGQPFNDIARWDGINWQGYGAQEIGKISVATVYQQELYIAGNFNNNALKEIARWDGTQWQNVGNGFEEQAWVDAMCVYKGELYAAGYFFKSSGNAGNFIQKWNGSEWSEVGGGTQTTLGVPNSNAQIHSMLVHHDSLFVSGAFRYAGELPSDRIAVWDGSRWCGHTYTMRNRVTDMVAYGDRLVFAGARVIGNDTVGAIGEIPFKDFVEHCGPPVAVNEVAASQFKLFPNPTAGRLQLEAGHPLVGQPYQIFDGNGRRVKTGVLHNQLELFELENGIYWLSAGTHTHKLVLLR